MAKLISNLAKSELGKLNLKSTTRLFLLEMGSCFTSGVLVSCLKLSNWLFMQIGSNYSPSIWGENNEATKAQGCRPKHLAALSSVQTLCHCSKSLRLLQHVGGAYWTGVTGSQMIFLIFILFSCAAACKISESFSQRQKVVMCSQEGFLRL